MIDDKYFEEIISKIDNLTDIVTTNSFLENIEIISNIAVDFVVVLGGVLGFLYLKKLKEKQVNAVFNYLTQLQVRLKKLYTIYVTYEDSIMEHFIPQTKRREEVDGKSSFIDQIVTEFAKNALETLNFLSKSQEQMPASKDWTSKYEILIEFLVDAEHLSIETFYKWIDDDEKKRRQIYAKKHKKNLKGLLNDIREEQEKYVDKLFHKKLQKIRVLFHDILDNARKMLIN